MCRIMKAHRVGVVFDLDGTLLDYKVRYHAAFRDVLKQYDVCCPDADTLFESRRQTGSTREVLTIMLKKAGGGLDILDECLRKREETMEEWRYLKMDRCFGGVRNVLQSLKSQGLVLSVISNRKSKELALKTLKKEGLLKFFDAVSTRNDSPDNDPKVGLLKNIIAKFSLSQCFYVGDTADDIRVGKRAGARTIAVLSGVDGKELIVKEDPDFLIESVSRMPTLE